jgi:hypothetical protein
MISLHTIHAAWDAALMLPGRLPDALDPGFHCARTHWIRGFMAFKLGRRTRTVMLMVLVWPESGFWRLGLCGRMSREAW